LFSSGIGPEEIRTFIHQPSFSGGIFCFKEKTMNQIPIKSTCNACGGEGILPTDKNYILGGREHPLLSQCAACEGKGTLLTWVDIHQLSQMLHAIAAEEQTE
jgi:hypothetical protein